MRIYDNGGRSFDRYTVVFYDGGCLGIGDTGNVPNGFCMHVGTIQDGDAVEGSHLGKRITLQEMTTAARAAVRNELLLMRRLRKELAQ